MNQKLKHTLFHNGIATYALMFGLMPLLGYGALSTFAGAADGTVDVVVRAKGQAGNERVELKVRDQTVKSFKLSRSFKNFSYVSQSEILDSDIKVVLTNAGGNKKSARQADIDYITVNGTKFESEASNVFSTGVAQPNGDCQEGYQSSSLLSCNGYFNYSIGDVGRLEPDDPGDPNDPDPNDPGASTTVDVLAKGSTGEEKIELRLVDQTVQTWDLTTAWTTYTFKSDTELDTSNVKVAFVNDGNTSTGADKNVQVDNLVVDGVKYEAEAPETFSTGTWRSADGCAHGYRESQWLSCGGHFEFTLEGTDPVGMTCGELTQVTVSPPANDLAQVVDGHPANTCFMLTNGAYAFGNILPKEGMVFVGESQAGVVVDGNGYENAFSGVANNVQIKNFTLTNYNNDAGHKLQEQAPIRATRAIWVSQQGDMGLNWLIENMTIHSNIASGIHMGEYTTIRNNTLHSNGVTGIVGNRFRGGLIENNTIYGNGFNSLTGAEVNGANIKVTQTDGAEAGDELIIRGNEVYGISENSNDRGIWMDVDANGVIVEDNVIHDLESFAIFFEVSRNGVARNNTVYNNTRTPNWIGEWNNGAIAVGESENILIEGNTIRNARAALAVRQTERPSPSEDWLRGYMQSHYVNVTTKNITIRNNTIEQSDSVGASHGPTGEGLIDYETITFEGNSYDNPDSMEFWWDRSSQSYSQWTSSGRQ